MASPRRVTSDTAITGASVADGDLFDVVDVSDATDAGTGTNKKITAAETAIAMRTRITAGGDASGALNNLALASTGVVAGTYGDATHVARTTYDAKGRATAVSSVAITAGSSGGLPASWYDVTNNSIANLDKTGGTSSSAALTSLIANIPAFGKATFIWPDGDYVFATPVEWGERSIRNMGTGFSGAHNFPLDGTRIFTGANSITAFTVTGGSGGQRALFQAGPSFENMWFCDNGSHSATKGLKVQAANRIHLRNVGFNGLTTGMELDASGGDCAWHNFENIHWHNCQTGFLGTASNSWHGYGWEMTDCNIGMDMVSGNSIIVRGIKINAPGGFGSPGGVAGIGLRLGVTGTDGMHDSVFEAIIEMGSGTNSQGSLVGGRTAVQVRGNSGADTSGVGIKTELGLHLGVGADANFGLTYDAGSHDCRHEIFWAVAGTRSHILADSGTRNNGYVYGEGGDLTAGNYSGVGAPGFNAMRGSLYQRMDGTSTTANVLYVNTTSDASLGGYGSTWTLVK